MHDWCMNVNAALILPCFVDTSSIFFQNDIQSISKMQMEKEKKNIVISDAICQGVYLY